MSKSATENPMTRISLADRGSEPRPRDSDPRLGRARALRRRRRQVTVTSESRPQLPECLRRSQPGGDTPMMIIGSKFPTRRRAQDRAGPGPPRRPLAARPGRGAGGPDILRKTAIWFHLQVRTFQTRALARPWSANR